MIFTPFLVIILLNHFNFSIAEYSNEQLVGKRTMDDIPKFLLQVGQPRQATTLQHRTICVFTLMRIIEAGLNTTDLICQYTKSFRNKQQEYAVIKIHEPRLTYNNSIYSTAWVFGTDYNYRELTLCPSDNNCTYYGKNDHILTVNITTLQNMGLMYVISLYQNVFKLREYDIHHVRIFLKYWEILRKCCGLQMSMSYRITLNPYLNSSSAHYRAPSSEPHECVLYNIDAVYEAITKTYIGKLLNGTNLDHVMRPSDEDKPYYATYCSDYNYATKALHLGFNGKVKRNF